MLELQTQTILLWTVRASDILLDRCITDSVPRYSLTSTADWNQDDACGAILLVKTHPGLHQDSR